MENETLMGINYLELREMQRISVVIAALSLFFFLLSIPMAVFTWFGFVLMFGSGVEMLAFVYVASESKERAKRVAVWLLLQKPIETIEW